MPVENEVERVHYRNCYTSRSLYTPLCHLSWQQEDGFARVLWERTESGCENLAMLPTIVRGKNGEATLLETFHLTSAQVLVG